MASRSDVPSYNEFSQSHFIGLVRWQLLVLAKQWTWIHSHTCMHVQTTQTFDKQHCHVTFPAINHQLKNCEETTGMTPTPHHMHKSGSHMLCDKKCIRISDFLLIAGAGRRNTYAPKSHGRELHGLDASHCKVEAVPCWCQFPCPVLVPWWRYL